jgi:hypothetical protein
MGLVKHILITSVDSTVSIKLQLQDSHVISSRSLVVASARSISQTQRQQQNIQCNPQLERRTARVV